MADRYGTWSGVGSAPGPPLTDYKFIPNQQHSPFGAQSDASFVRAGPTVSVAPIGNNSLYAGQRYASPPPAARGRPFAEATALNHTPAGGSGPIQLATSPFQDRAPQFVQKQFEPPHPAPQSARSAVEHPPLSSDPLRSSAAFLRGTGFEEPEFYTRPAPVLTSSPNALDALPPALFQTPTDLNLAQELVRAEQSRQAALRLRDAALEMQRQAEARAEAARHSLGLQAHIPLQDPPLLPEATPPANSLKLNVVRTLSDDAPSSRRGSHADEDEPPPSAAGLDEPRPTLSSATRAKVPKFIRTSSFSGSRARAVSGDWANELEQQTMPSSSKKDKKKKKHRKTHKMVPKKVHKMNEMGQIVDPKGHPARETACNLQLGIETTVRQQDHKPHRTTTFDDYQSNFVWEFPREGSAVTPPHPNTAGFKFKDYCPAVFRELREMFSIDSEEYIRSLCGVHDVEESRTLRIMGTPGKSGSIFFYSGDMRFIIKSLPKREAQLLRQILPNYHQHVAQNPGTLLPHFFGLCRLKPDYSTHYVRFVIMNNVFATHRPIHLRYDLKGSTQGRTASARDRARGAQCVYKDLDLIEMGQQLHLHRPQGEEIMQQLRKDCTLLMALGVMDYSLLVGVHYPDSAVDDDAPRHVDEPVDILADAQTGHGIRSAKTPRAVPREHGVTGDEFDPSRQATAGYEVYYMGIIDILMTYTVRKKMEKVWKRATGGKGASSVPPVRYAKRFAEFIASIMCLEDHVCAPPGSASGGSRDGAT